MKVGSGISEAWLANLLGRDLLEVTERVTTRCRLSWRSMDIRNMIMYIHIILYRHIISYNRFLLSPTRPW